MYRIGKTGKLSLCILLGIIVWFQIILNYNLSTHGDGRFGNGNGNSGGENVHPGTPSFINVPEPRALSQDEIKNVSEKISQMNEEQKIYNEDKFGPVTEETFVLVIQVHLRVEYLTLLIESLSRVQNIENCLLIFSHDVYVPELNEAIQNVDFTRIMQIFYPTSIQLNPHTFPGDSPDDCQRDVPPAKARQIKCRNADHPDSYGHYREARYTQTKHHWWWKANFVFGSVRVLENYSGVVTFLEEDHYVTPDFLWVLNLMETLMTRNLCKGCNLLALGTYLKTWNIRSAHETATVTNWVSSKHNMGMAFNRTMWNNLLSCSKIFCQYDDYNWDWSLLQVSYHCLKTPLTVLYAKAPRIFHIGDCGVHHKKKMCDPAAAAQQIDKGVKKFQSFLFPDNLNVEVFTGKKLRLKKGNGGWGDRRDHELCLNFQQNQTVV